ncbi:YcaO-like family protein [Reinekea blandensis]|uniref:YcaO domain-containing protein n=1 Tax=Reinekea blandensis MED297 TaxID=314283 RepID=A4BAS4_9GAMM|nr:YcaO-like family protein [Reinekea blandensis]EAR11030.1 hypothetical protein MED297_10981 [Reinekea sp. MED297] [Reinekea blandensis MED297]
MIHELDYYLIELDNPFCSDLPKIIAVHDKNLRYTSMGRGSSIEMRTITAYGEILERYCLWNQTPDLTSAFCADKPMLSPEEQVLPISESIDDREVEWKSYYSLSNHQRIFIHRPINSACYSNYFTQTSNGSAVHETEELAINSALEELIERHLFNIFWLFESNILEKSFSSDEIEHAIESGWRLDFYEIRDYKSCTICVMINRSDRRFSKGAMTVGLSFGSDSDACIRAYTECLQTLEAYLAFDKKVNNASLYYLSGKGTSQWQRKINTSLSSTPLSITKSVFEKYSPYMFTEKTNNDLVYCEVVMPHLIPLQYEHERDIRVNPDLLGHLTHRNMCYPIG